jgi:hypothetical protein
MVTSSIIVLISLLNMLLAFGMVYTFDDAKLLKNKPFRLFILIPPVAVTIAFCVTIYGILYCLYILLSNYLK